MGILDQGRRPAILIADDEAGIRTSLARILKREGFDCTTVADGAQAIRALDERSFDVVLTDYLMPEQTGLQVLAHANSKSPPPPVVLMTAYGSGNLAADAFRQGVADYLEKPLTNEVLIRKLREALGGNRLWHRRPTTIEPKEAQALVGSSSWLDPFMTSLRRAAATNATVLIVGPTGTGKSSVVTDIWRASQRSAQPLVVVDCTTVPANLFESELFGVRKGAYTGADADRPGRIDAAQGGTLFLDEIGELSPEVQGKLLTLLQKREYTPIGHPGEPLTADVRFIAATNRDLRQLVAEGRFRSDLLFRLEVVRLAIPPLETRLDDVPLLVEHFCRLVPRTVGIEAPIFTPEAIDYLGRYSWPGNVRELEMVVTNAAILFPPPQAIGPAQLADRIPPSLLRPPRPRVPEPTPEPDRGRDAPEPASEPEAELEEAAPLPTSDLATVQPSDVDGIKPAPGSGLIIDLPPIEAGPFDIDRLIEDAHRRVLESALAHCGYNVTRAAEYIGVLRTTFIERAKRFGVAMPARPRAVSRAR